MNFAFSEDQEMLRETARRFLAEHCTSATVRSILEGPAPHDAALWRQITEMGWAGAAIAEEFGGLGLGYLELCVIAEELGRVLAPVPFSSSIYLAAEALSVAGTTAQKQAWLPKLASGEAIGTLAFAEGQGALAQTGFRAEVLDGRLSGTKTPVADGAIADVLIVAAQEGGTVGLYLVDAQAPGLNRRELALVDPSRAAAEITFDAVPAEKLAGGSGDGWADLRRVLDAAAILTAFEQVGGADRCLMMARDYSLERHAFGRPIGSFQALKHRMADMYVKNEIARGHAYYGAWALSTQAGELPLAAAAARASACDAWRFAAEENLQIHGGMGATWEYDCHLYLRREKLLAVQLGSARSWKDRLIGQIERRNAA